MHFLHGIHGHLDCCDAIFIQMALVLIRDGDHLGLHIPHESIKAILVQAA